MDSITRLFGSAARVKLLRLFIFNKEQSFTLSDICTRAKVTPEEARGELSLLNGAEVIKKSGSGVGTKYRINHRFEHIDALDAFILTTTILRPKDFLTSLKKAGSIRVVVLSGFFTGVAEAQIDLLIVGDRLNERSLASACARLEAELGREVRYATFTTDDYRYRQGIYDRLIRDIFDYPHRTLLDTLTR